MISYGYMLKLMRDNNNMRVKMLDVHTGEIPVSIPI